MIAHHATSKDNQQSILEQGFIIQKQGQNGSHFGTGIYLASTKSLAKQYGKHIVSVTFDARELYHLTNWLNEYMRKCDEVYAAGTPANDVNTVVGEYYKHMYTAQGYKGLIIDGIVGTSKEIVIYDTNIIQDIYK